MEEEQGGWRMQWRETKAPRPSSDSTLAALWRMRPLGGPILYQGNWVSVLLALQMIPIHTECKTALRQGFPNFSKCQNHLEIWLKSYCWARP